ncbi:hypothetical protein F5Y07DRAFT_349671 [Xylaria sp. FL0933]|nr:hypothetical protein F5Y07DRAFT_349671 [Xylaria sp. FL0933]
MMTERLLLGVFSLCYPRFFVFCYARKDMAETKLLHVRPRRVYLVGARASERCSPSSVVSRITTLGHNKKTGLRYLLALYFSAGSRTDD